MWGQKNLLKDSAILINIALDVGSEILALRFSYLSKHSTNVGLEILALRFSYINQHSTNVGSEILALRFSYLN